MDKGERGKAVELTGDKADAKYVTWDQSVTAIELEVNTLFDFIFSLTQTPNISFDEMKQLGALSGVAFDRVFIDAHLPARHEVDGEYLQRDLHLIKAFDSGLISGVTATRLSNLVTDPAEERERIERENDTEDGGDKNDKKQYK